MNKPLLLALYLCLSNLIIAENYDPALVLKLSQSDTLTDKIKAKILQSREITRVYSSPESVNITGYQTQKIQYSQSSKTLQFISPSEKNIQNINFDYIIIGSGPAGSVLASELRQNNKTALLIEQGDFILPGTVDTRLIPSLRNNKNIIVPNSGILLRNGEVVGGAASVNIDLAFSPLSPSVQHQIATWKKEGHLLPDTWSYDDIHQAYQWVQQKIGTRQLTQEEVNKNNELLYSGAKQLGLTPSLYALNTYKSPYQVTNKKSPVERFIIPAMMDSHNPLYLLNNCEAKKITTQKSQAKSVQVFCTPPKLPISTDNAQKLKYPLEQIFQIQGKNIILSAGSLGSAKLLLQSNIKNNNIGKGIILHPSMPIIGFFQEKIRNYEGLPASVYLDDYAISDKFILEASSAEPVYVAQAVLQNPYLEHNLMSRFDYAGGFGVMLIDTPSPTNKIEIGPTQEIRIHYSLNAQDKRNFRKGISKAAQILFSTNAQKVCLPSIEVIKSKGDTNCFHSLKQLLIALNNIDFMPYSTLVTSAHMQATNKMGNNPLTSVVDNNHKVWGYNNLYVVDSSIFPGSIGANPMQSIYTMAKLFSNRQNRMGK